MPYSVLIVNTSKNWRGALSSFFEKRGFKPTGCAAFDEAERLVEERHFAVAVIDYFSDDDNGGKLCDLIRARADGETALIVISGKQTEAIEMEIRSRSPAYYFVKPCSFENLYAVALKACEERDRKELQKIQMLNRRQEHAVKHVRC